MYILSANSYSNEGSASDALRVWSRGLAYRESSAEDTADKVLVLPYAHETYPKNPYLRMTVLAAKADAATDRYVSIM